MMIFYPKIGRYKVSWKLVMIALITLFFVEIFLVFHNKEESDLTSEFVMGRWNFCDNLNVSSYMLKTRTKLQPVTPIQSDVLIFVNSKVTNNIRRQEIRQTWGALARNFNISVIFHVSNNESLYEEILREEHNQYKDILQNDLVDSYQNLTLKSSFMLYWTGPLLKEQTLRYIIKVDDDIWLNLDQLNKYLLQIAEDSVEYKRSYLAGHINKYYCKVERSPQHKNSVPSWMYPHELFPHYLIGAFYVIPASFVPCLIGAMSHARLVSVEDVYVTGILRELCNIDLFYIPNSDPTNPTYERSTTIVMLSEHQTMHDIQNIMANIM